MAWQTHKEAGNRCFVEGQHVEAEQHYDKALLLASAAGTTDEIGALFSNRWPKGYYRAAQSLVAMRRWPEAAAILQIAAKQCGRHSELSALLEEVQGALAAQDTPISLTHHSKAPEGCLPPDALPPQLRHGYVFQGSGDGVNENLLLLLHGLGDTAAPFARLAKQLALPQTASLALCGPLQVLEGEDGRCWFPAFDSQGELLQAGNAGRVRVEGLKASVSAIQQLLGSLQERGWPPSRVHLFGFSQGATVALEVAQTARGHKRLGGCAVVGGSILEELLDEEGGVKQGGSNPGGSSSSSGGEDSGTPVVMIHGDADQVVPLRLARRTQAVLEGGGSATELHVVAGKGHSMLGGRGEVRPLMAFWGRTLAYRPPGEGVLEVKS